MPCEFGGALTEDAEHSFWIASDTGVCKWNAIKSEVFETPDKSFVNLRGAAAFAELKNKSMLVGFSRPGQHTGLQIDSDGRWSAFKCDGLDGTTLFVIALLIDREGGLWIGTQNAGIYHVKNGKADHFTSADGLTSDDVLSLYEDQEGSVWVGTIGGVDRFHELSVVPLSVRDGMSSDQHTAVFAERDGSIWVSGPLGIDVFKDGEVGHFNKSNGLPGQTPTALLQDHLGATFVGVDDKLTVYRGKKFEIIRKPDGTSLGVMRALAEDSSHDVWAIAVGNVYRLYRVRNYRFLDEIKLPSDPIALAISPSGKAWVELENGSVGPLNDGVFHTSVLGAPAPRRHMMVQSDGNVLIGARSGLHHSLNGKWSVLDSKSGLPCNAVFGMAYDQQERLWLRLQCGIAIIDGEELSEFWHHRISRVAIKLLDATDGARSGEATFLPSETRSADGRLWFATDGVVLSVDPLRLQTNTRPPPVRIEQIIADHTKYDLRANPALPPHTRDVEIDYAGLSFVMPQKVRYQYRLLGLDKEWQEVGARKSAFFMDLPPGSYEFQVKATNNSGIWSPTGAVARFSIKPAFYQTLTFQVFAALICMALLWFVLTLRVRYATSQAEARLTARQSERIRIARDLHDTLLQGFHGLMARFQAVANGIPTNEPIRANIEQILDRADVLLIESRDRVRDLRSVEDGGSPLSDELQRVAFDLERDTSIPIEIKLIGTPVALNGDVQREVLAIAKEALTNAALHSKATVICCELIYARTRLKLTCADDGSGIDPDVLRAGGRDGHWGLTGMKERARQIGGSLRIRSAPGQGTLIELTVKARISYVNRKNAWTAVSKIFRLHNREK
jgi:signal transduction histidine kinase/ligand-binding sensor domain-containing protein